MKMLVTGGAGFIGTNFIHYWLKNHPEDRVSNLDMLTYAGNLENLTDVEANPNYSFIKGDIRDSKAVDAAMEGIDVVVHFAAESHVDRSILEPSTFITTNVVGTQVLLDAAVKHKVLRFHHISTDEVFGSLELESEQKFTEKSSYAPHSPYAASKAGSDLLVLAYHDTFGLPVTITNTSNNYGPYQFPEKLIPLMIINALRDKPLPIYGDGKNIRDWLFVGDHCRAIELVLEAGKPGETYCIGGGAERNNLDVVKSILSILKKPESLIQFVTDRPGHDRRYAVDYSKAKNNLGYVPQHNFEEWLEKTVSWYVDNKDWWGHILSQEYKTYFDKQYGSRLTE